MKFAAIRKKAERYAIGLMSGSSCDGVGAALVRLKGTGPGLHMKLIQFKTFPYAGALRRRLLAPRMDSQEICTLNFELGEEMAKAVANLVNVARNDELVEVDFVASSGHTVAHLPPRNGGAIGTLQIGEPAVIAERTSLPVVSDFRQRDMAAGGQGAPLVPYADWLLFHREDRTVAFLNLGGIANITVVPPAFEDVLAFDTGPANMAIDGAVRLLSQSGEEMDKDGIAASQGIVIDEFLEYLLDHPYFVEEPPKSTGREEFGPEVYLRDALASRKDHPYEDLIATVTTAVAYSIVRAINRYVKPNYDITRLIVSGGGAHNNALLRRIRQGIPDLKIRKTDRYGIPVDAKEAVAFAILGNETLCDTPANVPHATGAKRSVVLGKITPN